MIVLAGLILGVVTGVLKARKLGGKPLDIAQYAAGYGIAFTLIGVFITIFIDRMI